MPKYFFNSPIHCSASIILEGDTAHHLLHVLRKKAGDCVLLCDGAGKDYDCVIEKADSKKVSLLLSVKAVRPCHTEAPVRVTLYQGYPKSDKMELIVQKSVELGVARVVPVLTARTIVRVSKEDTKLARLQRIALSAAEQSMRGVVPEIGKTLTFAEAFASAAEAFHIAAYEQADTLSIRRALENMRPASVGLWIGPEGGFSDQEAAFFVSRRVPLVTLGPRILRTETAALAALVQLLGIWEAS